jgi:predicted DNA binding CopG/RHH family protein
MKRHDGYTDEPIGPLRVIKDFLPPPDQLILKEDGVKVTISLSKRSVDFFKKHAKKSRIPYQRMIRRVLDEYASAYSAKPRRG